MAVTRDATSGIFFPANATEAAQWLAGTGIGSPFVLHQLQEPVGPFVDSISGVNLTNGSMTTQTPVTGWARFAISASPDGSGHFAENIGSWPDLNTTSTSVTFLVEITNIPSGLRTILGLGGAVTGDVFVNFDASGNYELTDHTNTGTGSVNHGTGVVPVTVRYNQTGSAIDLFIGYTSPEKISKTFVRPASGSTTFGFGAFSSTTPVMGVLGDVAFSGSTAEMTDAQVIALHGRFVTGFVASIAVTPNPVSLSGVGTRQLDAIATMGDGSTYDATSDANAVWSSSSPSVATVSSTGLVTAVGGGSTTITCTYGGATSAGDVVTVTSNAAIAEAVPTFSVVLRPSSSLGSNVVVLGAGTSASAAVSTDPNGTPLPLPTANSPAPSDALANPGATIDALQAGSAAIKYVVAIEGYPCLLTNADPAKAVLAWSNTDWTQAVGGLFINLDNQQQLDPWTPFQKGGTCILSVLPDAVDRFGIDVHRAADGAEASLALPCNRIGTPQEQFYKMPNGGAFGIGEELVYTPYIYVDNSDGFVAGDVHIGTECISVSNPGPGPGLGVFSSNNSAMQTYVRGKYSPFGSGGSGGPRFAQHHRVTTDPQGVLLNPAVSAQPRVWVGRWVSVYMHTVNGAGVLNAQPDAQRVFAGQIVSISDDADTMCTVVELQHVLSVISDVTVGRDIFSATAPTGLYIPSGLQFGLVEDSDSANNLVVVDSGAAGTNQINAGYYTPTEICAFLNTWLSAELTAARITGYYSWASPVSSNVGLRTKCYWSHPGLVNSTVSWALFMPALVYAYLGMDNELESAETYTINGTRNAGASGPAGTDHILQGSVQPWSTIMFTRTADDVIQLNVTNCIGTLIDQWALIPSTNRPPQQGLTWGIFLVNEQWIMYASFDQQGTVTTLSNCGVFNYVVPGVQFGTADISTFGTRAGDANDTTPITVRQVYLLEANFNTLIKTLFYGSGTPGYNHPTFDVLGYGLGIAIPGALLGEPFETSVDNQPGWIAPMVLVIDEPTKLADLLSVDLILRHGFPMWRSDGGADGRGGLTFGRWQTPLEANAVAALTEDNKAEPSGNAGTHRAATVLDATWVKNIVKIDYNRDFTVSKDGNYQNTITIEDETAVDDSGGVSNVATLEARNTYSQYLGTGAGIELLAPGFLAMLPMFSRPVRKATRSIDQTLYEGLHIGDVVLVDDTFMRDPATGTRGVSGREATVTRHRYNPGGLAPGTTQPTSQVGEVDIVFLDNHRGGPYAPSALVNTAAASFGFDSVLRRLHVLSHSFSLSTEAADWKSFAVHDRIRITQRDPDDPNNAPSWQAEILAIDAELVVTSPFRPALPGAAITLDRVIGPLFSSASFIVTYDRYDQVAPLQQTKSFLASLATNRIEKIAQPFQLSSTNEPNAPVANVDVAEILPASAYADGAPMDVGSELALARTLNVLIDSKTARQSIALGEPGLGAVGVPAVSPIWLGLDAANQTIERFLSIAIAYQAEGPGQIRATLSQWFPQPANGASILTGAPLLLQFQGVFSQATWDIQSIGHGVTAVTYAQQLAVTAKSPTGFGWLSIEVLNSDQIFALYLVQCRESIRTNNEVLR